MSFEEARAHVKFVMRQAGYDDNALDTEAVYLAAKAMWDSPVFQPAYGPWDDTSRRAAQSHAILGACAAVTAYSSHIISGEANAEFEVWQDDTPVASSSGPRNRALADAQHYAIVYGQDGPVSLCEVVRFQMPLPVLTSPSH